MTTILITGVAGLLGSRIAEHFLKTKSGVKIIGIDDLSGGFASNVPFGVDFHQINCVEDLDDIFAYNKVDVVYHLAAYAAEALSPFIRKFNYTNNLVATSNIVTACIKHGVRRLVFTSSMAVYGHGRPPFDEEQPRMPIDPYGVAKAACEQDIEIAAEQHGLDYCIIRPHNVYGRNQNLWDSYRNVIGIFMYKQLRGDPLTVFGDGKQTRAFSEMTDSLEPFWVAGFDEKASKQIINLGGIEEYSINEVIDTFKQMVDSVQVIHLPARHEVKHAIPTYQKSMEILGFEYKTSLYDGMLHMWQWAQNQPQRERFIWSKYELDTGLYPQWKPEALKDGFFK